MNFKNLFLTILLTIFSSTIFASSFLDSLGVENQDGKKIILHQLDAKDNYYSIGRHYGIHPVVIMNFNNNIALKVGQVIKVPTALPFENKINTIAPSTTAPSVKVNKPTIAKPAEKVEKPLAGIPATPEQPQPPEIQYTEYKVGAGETLFAIARRFNTKVESLILLNNLKNNNLTPGQLLKIKRLTPPAPTLPDLNASEMGRDSTSPVFGRDTAERRLPNNRYGLYEKNEKGVAVWIDDASLDSSKKLILHRNAPVGTVIKITNPMTNRTTFAKVVGRFTENETTKDVILVMTKDVAESLGAIDKRFHVNISYGSPDE